RVNPRCIAMVEPPDLPFGGCYVPPAPASSQSSRDTCRSSLSRFSQAVRCLTMPHQMEVAMPVQTRQPGFTVIELLITVAVVVVLLAVAVPSFIDFLEKARVKGAADDIVSMVSTVRAEAVKIGRDVTVSVGGTTTAWCVGANSAGVPALTQP